MALTRSTAGAVAATLLLTAASAPAATPEDARRAYEAGHFTDAMGIWAELSQQGDAEAAYGIGLMYDLGNGTKEDPGAAFAWYRTAAEAGIPAAEFNVAAMFDAGRGVGQDSASAALWYAKAAARGHARAQYDLGQLYEQGDGVPRNVDSAAAWYRDAATGGIKAAAQRLKSLAPGARDSKPQAVSLVAPDRDAKLTLPSDNPAVELVWATPPEPWPARYEIQVRELDDTKLAMVFSATVAETAMLVHLPVKSAFYVWNVSATGPDGSHVPSDWNWFTVNPATQSLASGPH